MKRKKVLIMGAAGRDFHNFNTVFRGNPEYEVVAFTATQIPNIDGRTYPAELCGELYPQGIPIHDEAAMPQLIREHGVEEVVFAYTDVPYQYVMNRCALVNSLGADFRLLGYDKTRLRSTRPVISICAVRTGCGKSQTTRYICEIFKRMARRVVAVRHPMPYGNLYAQRVQRFAEIRDLESHQCTIEEMEEYEPHIAAGNVIYAGVDYEAILRCAEKDPAGEPDVIVWDGGNNDFPFFDSDLKVVVIDPLRPGHETGYYAGEINLCMADVIVINKMDSAAPRDAETVKANCSRLAPRAVIIEADSTLSVAGDISGKSVLVVEDGPTLTHGEMKIGAASVAAHRFGAARIVDPRPSAVGSIAATYQKYPEVGEGILPAMGYGEEQIRDLEATINAVDADLVLSGTPIDLARIVRANKPIIRVSYELSPRGNGAEALERVIVENLFR
ncbi:MAG: GTPase [Spirochaetaceae bacterium]|nr:MAG: GTPase [Spirochaetaceae bacterium]